jgi:DNA-binding CsgD family transcriptional regulator
LDRGLLFVRPITAADAGAHSELLLKLYVAARAGSVESFQQQAIALLAQQLAFDNVWWGRSNVEGPRHNVHCSYLWNLPADTPQRMNRDDPTNPVAQRTTQRPGRAHRFDYEELISQPATAAFTAHMGINQALVIALLEQQGAVVSFVSVSRTTATPRFTEDERRLLELWMPHLTSALDLCCMAHMGRMRQGGSRAMVTTDLLGWLHVFEPGAPELLRSEWPGWTGRQLPAPLREQIAERRSVYLGRHLHVEIRWHGEHVLLSMRPREPSDLLSRQENAVAEAFSSGHSYKEVARTLDLAPATVRHHLRAVYMKLGVSDKAALARVLNTASHAPSAR